MLCGRNSPRVRSWSTLSAARRGPAARPMSECWPRFPLPTQCQEMNESRRTEPTAEADRGRHSGSLSFNVVAGGPFSLAERSGRNSARHPLPLSPPDHTLTIGCPEGRITEAGSRKRTFLRENPMSDPNHGSLRAAAAGRGRGARSLAMLGALVLVGVSLYASRGELPPAVLSSMPAFATAVEQNGDGKPSPQTARAVAAANAFLDSLDAKQRDKALLEFGSAKRSGWSNLPVTMVARNGVRLGDLTKVQRAAAMDAVAAVLRQ